MPSTTAAGTALAISSGIPATADVAGFAALTFTEVGGVDKIGTIGVTFGKVEFQPLKGPKDKLKGSPDYGGLQPSMAFDEADAGQTLLRAAAEDTTQKLYAVRVTYSTGAIRYFRGRVFSAPETVDGAESVLMTNSVIEICTKPVKVAATGGTPTPSPTPTPTPTPTVAPLATRFVYMGDSRVNSMYNDGAQQNKGAGSHLTVGSTQLGQRINHVANYAVAGQRSDQYNSSTSAMAAAAADTLVVFGVVNDISQGRTGADCWTTVKAIIDAAWASGKKAIAHTEPGAEAFTATLVGHRDTFNASLADYAAANPTKLAVFDFASAALVNFAPGVVPVFKSGYSPDGIHLGHLGARMVGTAYAAWIDSLLGGSRILLPALQGQNLIANASFATKSGSSTRYTGTPPTGFTVSNSGTNTGTISYAALGSGGEELILQSGGAASGDRIQFSKQLVATDIGVALNDKVRFLVEVAQDAGSAPIRSIRAYVTGLFDGLTKSKQLFDMQPDSRATWGNTVTTAYTDLLMPPDLVLALTGATTLDRVDITIVAEFGGAGSGTIRIRTPTLLKIV